MSYTDGTPKTVTSASDGSYSFTVSYNWSGTVTPSLTGYTFSPPDRDYSTTPVTADLASQDFSASSTLFTNCASVTEIPQSECEALVALFNNTNGAAWTTNTNWLLTNTPCLWYGVNCWGRHVKGVNLTNNQLSGSIPTELGNLNQLADLHLGENQLSGNIPPQLGSLTNLIWLDLENNQLSGSVPTELGNLNQLTELDLYQNQLSGSIPSQLGNLTNLQYLWLGNNQLSGSIPISLGNLTQLTDLGLWGNQLNGSIPLSTGQPDPANKSSTQ